VSENESNYPALDRAETAALEEQAARGGEIWLEGKDLRPHFQLLLKTSALHLNRCDLRGLKVDAEDLPNPPKRWILANCVLDGAEFKGLERPQPLRLSMKRSEGASLQMVKSPFQNASWRHL